MLSGLGELGAGVDLVEHLDELGVASDGFAELPGEVLGFVGAAEAVGAEGQAETDGDGAGEHTHGDGEGAVALFFSLEAAEGVGEFDVGGFATGEEVNESPGGGFGLLVLAGLVGGAGVDGPHLPVVAEPVCEGLDVAEGVFGLTGFEGLGGDFDGFGALGLVGFDEESVHLGAQVGVDLEVEHVAEDARGFEAAVGGDEGVGVLEHELGIGRGDVEAVFVEVEGAVVVALTGEVGGVLSLDADVVFECVEGFVEDFLAFGGVAAVEVVPGKADVGLGVLVVVFEAFSPEGGDFVGAPGLFEELGKEAGAGLRLGLAVNRLFEIAFGVGGHTEVHLLDREAGVDGGLVGFALGGLFEGGGGLFVVTDGALEFTEGEVGAAVLGGEGGDGVQRGFEVVGVADAVLGAEADEVEEGEVGAFPVFIGFARTDEGVDAEAGVELGDDHALGLVHILGGVEAHEEVGEGGLFFGAEEGDVVFEFGGDFSTDLLEKGGEEAADGSEDVVVAEGIGLFVLDFAGGGDEAGDEFAADFGFAHETIEGDVELGIPHEGGEHLGFVEIFGGVCECVAPDASVVNFGHVVDGVDFFSAGISGHFRNEVRDLSREGGTGPGGSVKGKDGDSHVRVSLPMALFCGREGVRERGGCRVRWDWNEFAD